MTYFPYLPPTDTRLRDKITPVILAGYIMAALLLFGLVFYTPTNERTETASNTPSVEQPTTTGQGGVP
jgi:hypothetical protein